MSGNSFGKMLTVTTFGESHGPALGCVVDGYPAGIEIDEDFIQRELARRAPGQNRFSTQRREEDRVEILSGVFEGKSTGCPIAMLIRNTDQRSRDYSRIKDVFRPSHADYTYWMKYGNADYRGGGRSSGRETSMRVASGALAKLYLASHGITVTAGVRAIGSVRDTSDAFTPPFDNSISAVNSTLVPLFEKEIDEARLSSDSVGGVIECRAEGLPAGLGEPVFEKFSSSLAAAVMSIGACKGFEIGDGFALASMRGSQANDEMAVKDGRPAFLTNHSGGVLGGITNGNTVIFTAAFKPTPSIARSQRTVTKDLEETRLEITGRHDPCIVPRAVVVVEAMTALVCADFLLRARAYE